MKNIDEIDDYEVQQQETVVICICKTNDGCTKEEDGNGEWKDYCWKCKCFRN